MQIDHATIPAHALSVSPPLSPLLSPSCVQYYLSSVGIVILCGRMLRGYAVLPG